MKVTNIAASVARRFGRVAKKTGSTAGPAILAGGMFFAGPASAEVLFSENFNDLVLKEAVSDLEVLDFGEVWTDVPPEGWVRDNDDTPMPDPDDPAVGPDEFYGFSFVDWEWWIATAGDQERSFFTNGDGVIMVADPDEYDDLAKVDGRDLDEGGGVGFEDAMNVFITTPAISLNGFDRSTAQISFDSSFRPYDFMTGLLDVSFNNGDTWNNLLTLDLDAFDGVNSSLDRVDETIELNLGAPANAASAMFRFGLIHAGNDWWWAIDNIDVTADPGGAVGGDFNDDGQLTDTDIDLLSAEVRAGTNDASFDLNADSLVNDLDRTVWVSVLRDTYVGDANLDGEFNSGDLVQVLASGNYEADVDSGWASGDFNGDARTNSSDLVAALADGGYEAGPRAAASAVPEPTTILLGAFGLLALSTLRGRK
jgi:hypothetical protein